MAGALLYLFFTGVVYGFFHYAALAFGGNVGAAVLATILAIAWIVGFGLTAYWSEQK